MWRPSEGGPVEDLQIDVRYYLKLLYTTRNESEKTINQRNLRNLEAFHHRRTIAEAIGLVNAIPGSELRQQALHRADQIARRTLRAKAYRPALRANATSLITVDTSSSLSTLSHNTSIHQIISELSNTPVTQHPAQRRSSGSTEDAPHALPATAAPTCRPRSPCASTQAQFTSAGTGDRSNDGMTVQAPHPVPEPLKASLPGTNPTAAASTARVATHSPSGTRVATALVQSAMSRPVSAASVAATAPSQTTSRAGALGLSHRRRYETDGVFVRLPSVLVASVNAVRGYEEHHESQGSDGGGGASSSRARETMLRHNLERSLEEMLAVLERLPAHKVASWLLGALKGRVKGVEQAGAGTGMQPGGGMQRNGEWSAMAGSTVVGPERKEISVLGDLQDGSRFSLPACAVALVACHEHLPVLIRTHTLAHNAADNPPTGRSAAPPTAAEKRPRHETLRRGATDLSARTSDTAAVRHRRCTLALVDGLVAAYGMPPLPHPELQALVGALSTARLFALAEPGINPPSGLPPAAPDSLGSFPFYVRLVRWCAIVAVEHAHALRGALRESSRVGRASRDGTSGLVSGGGGGGGSVKKKGGGSVASTSSATSPCVSRSNVITRRRLKEPHHQAVVMDPELLLALTKDMTVSHMGIVLTAADGDVRSTDGTADGNPSIREGFYSRYSMFMSTMAAGAQDQVEASFQELLSAVSPPSSPVAQRHAKGSKGKQASAPVPTAAEVQAAYDRVAQLEMQTVRRMARQDVLLGMCNLLHWTEECVPMPMAHGGRATGLQAGSAVRNTVGHTIRGANVACGHGGEVRSGGVGECVEEPYIYAAGADVAAALGVPLAVVSEPSSGSTAGMHAKLAGVRDGSSGCLTAERRWGLAQLLLEVALNARSKRLIACGFLALPNVLILVALLSSIQRTAWPQSAEEPPNRSPTTGTPAPHALTATPGHIALRFVPPGPTTPIQRPPGKQGHVRGLLGKSLDSVEGGGGSARGRTSGNPAAVGRVEAGDAEAAPQPLWPDGMLGGVGLTLVPGGEELARRVWERQSFAEEMLRRVRRERCQALDTAASEAAGGIPEHFVIRMPTSGSFGAAPVSADTGKARPRTQRQAAGPQRPRDLDSAKRLLTACLSAYGCAVLLCTDPWAVQAAAQLLTQPDLHLPRALEVLPYTDPTWSEPLVRDARRRILKHLQTRGQQTGAKLGRTAASGPALAASPHAASALARAGSSTTGRVRGPDGEEELAEGWQAAWRVEVNRELCRLMGMLGTKDEDGGIGLEGGGGLIRDLLTSGVSQQPLTLLVMMR